MTHPTASADITALILAGGRGSRMGGVDKGLQNFQGTPLALHALMRLHLNADIAILVTVAFAIAVSWAIHVLVEAPTHRRGQQIARRLSA